MVQAPAVVVQPAGDGGGGGGGGIGGGGSGIGSGGNAHPQHHHPHHHQTAEEKAGHHKPGKKPHIAFKLTEVTPVKNKPPIPHQQGRTTLARCQRVTTWKNTVVPAHTGLKYTYIAKLRPVGHHFVVHVCKIYNVKYLQI
jgi:hypothetical protein